MLGRATIVIQNRSQLNQLVYSLIILDGKSILKPAHIVILFILVTCLYMAHRSIYSSWSGLKKRPWLLHNNNHIIMFVGQLLIKAMAINLKPETNSSCQPIHPSLPPPSWLNGSSGAAQPTTKTCCQWKSTVTCLATSLFGPKRYPWTHHRDYSHRPAGTHALHFCERK